MAFYRSHILVCTDQECVEKGAKEVERTLVKELKKFNLDNEIKVVDTGCLGPCEAGPLMVIYPEGVYYGNVQVEDVSEIVEEHLLKGRRVNRLLYEIGDDAEVIAPYQQEDVFPGEMRVVLRNCGIINPENIKEYIAQDGYQSLGKALTELTQEEVIEMVEESGLRGRGGAGFPTGLKWKFTNQADADEKYVVANADEGEPGTSKDRLIMEGDPHSLLEAMAIAGYAVGANTGYIYIRGEYQLAVNRLETAIEQAEELGLLGENIFDSGFDFKIKIREGAGAYVCGEETALLQSIEGERGEPQVKPPYPPSEGLWGKPTLINNVETLANIPVILEKGAKWYSEIGTESCTGTKVFTLSGDVENEGLIEVPMGTTLREIVEGFGGGIVNGREFKMAQTGGTSGGCIPKDLLDTPMDYDALAEVGTALGSGALLVMDDTHCIVDIAKCFMHFFEHESCGKCLPCREGNTRIYEILDRISKGEGVLEDLDKLQDLADVMSNTALCGLGQAAPTSIYSTLDHFKDEYLAHITAKVCATDTCQALVVDDEEEYERSETA
ncbi:MULTISPECIES: NADH-quinone oxidoreductase subunit NuoF [unclassified Candidatus Frackibacter]|uniref:NADH-quinone oxidoreductase subunit NuoF n=1 Tax=unclassified Candidatus Frackibacter TaxID=2648818 RepID=UPI000798D09F|nr:MULTISPECIES: NADH-quinone oxidoreductase subunit NuoF [unclassified Candidatus Frackibacter]KXS41233.1 MAG: FhbB [Candidatus Frackibacter sp. T328-2]SDC45212.1 NADP-reducing hydrogenase subunit HndC [Candidatus Frackibacter sp. WG11]SEM65099.1 NADP-reducing hydrogenase subunit HndC [Candidatus Frackibacter sp. WG12]SFL67316.1 NADP-reducing hydrogenase subunit HndC [Candidatus Frackibacter sp. WG13]